MNPAVILDDECEVVRNGCFGKPTCPAAVELANREYLIEQAQRDIDSVLESERTDDLVESVQEICEVRGGIPRQLTNLAIEKNLGQGMPRLTEQQAFELLGMQIVKDPGFGYYEHVGYQA